MGRLASSDLAWVPRSAAARGCESLLSRGNAGRDRRGGAQTMGRKLTCMAKDIANGVARRNREQLFFGGWLTTFQLTLSFEASNPCLIFETEDVDRDSGCVCAHANLKKLSRFSISIFYRVRSITYRWVADSLIFTVFTIVEP